MMREQSLSDIMAEDHVHRKGIEDWFIMRQKDKEAQERKRISVGE